MRAPGKSSNLAFLPLALLGVAATPGATAAEFGALRIPGVRVLSGSMSF